MSSRKLILGINVAPIGGELVLEVDVGDVIVYASSPVGVMFLLDAFQVMSQSHSDKKQRKRAKHAFTTLMGLIMSPNQSQEVN